MAQRWSRFSFHRFGGQFCSDLFRQKRSQHQSYLRQRTEDRRTRHYLAQSFAQHSLRQWAFHFLLDNITPDIQQIVIAHTRRTGGFTITASETAIEMFLRFKRDVVAFQHLFNQIDAPARPSVHRPEADRLGRLRYKIRSEHRRAGCCRLPARARSAASLRLIGFA